MRSRPLNRRTLVLGASGTAAVALQAARGVGAQDATPAATPAATPVAETTTYAASTEDFANPERGFSVDALSNSRAPSPLTLAALQAARLANISLVRRLYSMPTFRAGPMSPAFLAHVTTDFVTARTAGVKLIVRFAYNFNESDGNKEDAPQAIVLAHIEQLAPVLRRNADVIDFLEAGFLGQWGEWHDSTNGLDDVVAKRTVLAKLLAALPTSRMVAIRYPNDKRAIYGTDAPLGPAEAFNGTDRARTGHHNDCFLADIDDAGTYWPLDPASLEAQKEYLSRDNRYVVQSGETCNAVPPRTDCPTAVTELARMRWSSLNSEFNEDVLNGWHTQGCMPEIRRRLGYRFRLVQARIPDRVAAGGALTMDFDVANDGWSGPHNSRPVAVVLRHRPSGAKLALPVAADPRFWLAGETHTVRVNATLPGDLVRGEYDALLHLPDPEPGLAGRPEYAIRLANQDVWEPATGYNSFRKGVQVMEGG